jgi:tricorn protease
LDATLHRVTDEVFNEEAAWDLDGDFLYYLSDREFAPQISGFEWNFATNRTTAIFAVTLRKDGKSPFPPQSDEVTFDSKKAEGETKAEDEKPDAAKPGEDKAEAKPKPKKKETPFRIDWEGLGSRVTRVPIDGDNIDGLAVGKGHLVYSVTGARSGATRTRSRH